jgi:hypothetical protein
MSSNIHEDNSLVFTFSTNLNQTIKVRIVRNRNANNFLLLYNDLNSEFLNTTTDIKQRLYSFFQTSKTITIEITSSDSSIPRMPTYSWPVSDYMELCQTRKLLDFQFGFI